MKLDQLSPGMIVARNISGKSGYPIVTKGSKLTTENIKKLKDNRIVEVTILQTVQSKTDEVAQSNADAKNGTKTDIRLQNDKFQYENHQFLLDEIIRNEIKQHCYYVLRRNYFFIDFALKREATIIQLIDGILVDPHLLALMTISKANYPQMINIHSQILVLTLLIGMDFGMVEEQLITLGQAALLYRIGVFSQKVKDRKIGEIPIENNQTEMQETAQNGHELLKMWFDQEVARVAMDQFERYDGSGFPNFKSGNELSLSSKIIAVSSKFIYLQVSTPGKQTPSMELAMDYVMNGEGVWYDPNVVNSFRKFVHPYRLGSVVELRDTSLAIVVRHGTAPDYAPMIKMIYSKHTTIVDSEFVELKKYPELAIRRVLSESTR